MPGSNGNSTAPDGMELFEKIAEKSGNKEKVDKKNEFKEFEKVIDNKELGGKEILVKEVNKDQGKVLDLFDEQQLAEKINDAKDNTNKSKDVKDAYKVLGAYKKGKTGSYEQVLEQIEGEESLLKAKQRILNMIDENKDWNKNLKEAAKNIVEDLFKECNSVEEFEKRVGNQLNVIEGFDNIGDFFRSIPNLARQVSTLPPKIMIELFEKIGYTRSEAMKLLLEIGEVTWKQIVDWCTEKGQKISDIAKMVCERGKDQFKSFLSYLNEIGQDISEVLSVAREWVGKQWNTFMNFCGSSWETVKTFGISLIEKGEIIWTTIVDSLKNDRENVKAVVKTLFELGKIKLHEFGEWCKGIGEQGKELIISILEWNKKLISDFVNWCTESWDAGKEWFSDVFKTLIEMGKVKLEEFMEFCGNAWETVKDVVCIILVGLVKAGKLTMRVLFDTLIVIPAITIIEISKLLIVAGKEIYKGVEELAKFVADLAVAGWEKAKEMGIAFGDFMKNLMNQIKELGINFGKAIADFFKGMREGMKNLGVKITEFVLSTCDTVYNYLQKSWKNVSQFFMNLGMDAKDVIRTIYEHAQDKWNNFVNDALDLFDSLKQTLKDSIDWLINVCKIGLNEIGKALVTAGKFVEDFIKTAINDFKAAWSDLMEWCGNEISKIKEALINIYGQTKEGIINLMKFIGGAVLEAGKILLKIGIGTVALVILALKELGQSLADVAKLCINYVGEKIQKLCDLLADAYGTAKQNIIEIGQAVASAVRNQAEAVRNWILDKSKDAVEAINAMKEYINQKVSDLCNWLFEKGLQIKDIAKTIMTVFKGQIKEIAQGIKAFYDLCKDKMNMGRKEFKTARNSGVQLAADRLTID